MFFVFRLNITRLQSMAQIHSYYITNVKSELKFSSSNLGKDELESIMKEITTAMINNDDLFEEGEEEEEEIFSNDNNSNDLLMADIMNLNKFEQNEEIDNSNIDNIQPLHVNHRNININYKKKNIFQKKNKMNIINIPNYNKNLIPL